MHGCRRLVAHDFGEAGHVRRRIGHIAGLQRLISDRGLPAGSLFDGRNVVHQRHRCVVADVENPERRIGCGGIRPQRIPCRIRFSDTIGSAYDPFGDVLYIGEVARVFSVIEHIERLAGQNCLGEFEQRHVRPAPWPIDGEESQARRRQPEQVAVGVGHQLVRSLGRGIELQRMVGDLMLRERQLPIGAIDARCRRVGEVGRALGSAGLEDVEKPDDVRTDVVVRMGEAVPDARLRRKMDNAVEGLIEGRLDGTQIGEVGADETPAALCCFRPLGEMAKSGFFQRRIVVVIDRIEPDDFVTAFDQPLRHVKSDKSRRAGYQDFHAEFPEYERRMILQPLRASSGLERTPETIKCPVCL